MMMLNSYENAKIDVVIATKIDKHHIEVHV